MLQTPRSQWRARKPEWSGSWLEEKYTFDPIVSLVIFAEHGDATYPSPLMMVGKKVPNPSRGNEDAKSENATR